MVLYPNKLPESERVCSGICTYSNVVMDKIEECIKNGLTGNEDDNW